MRLTLLGSFKKQIFQLNYLLIFNLLGHDIIFDLKLYTFSVPACYFINFISKKYEFWGKIEQKKCMWNIYVFLWNRRYYFSLWGQVGVRDLNNQKAHAKALLPATFMWDYGWYLVKRRMNWTICNKVNNLVNVIILVFTGCSSVCV